MTTIDPTELTEHPQLRDTPKWENDSPRAIALRRDMQTTGLVIAILITEKNQIVDLDSRDRWLAAKALQLKNVPVTVVSPDEAASAYHTALCQRRHISLSARSFLLFPLHKKALDEAQHRAKEKLKKGPFSPSAIESRTAKSVDEIAAGIGVGVDMLKMARRVHEIFDKDPDYKTQMLPKLLREAAGGEHGEEKPVGLGAIIAGWAGKNSTEGDTRSAERRYSHLLQSVNAVAKWSQFTWDEVPHNTRKQLAASVADAVAKWPEELKDSVIEMLEAKA